MTTPNQKEMDQLHKELFGNSDVIPKGDSRWARYQELQNKEIARVREVMFGKKQTV